MTVLTSPRPVTAFTVLQEQLTVAGFGDLGRTGIIRDLTGLSWRVSSDGSSTTVTVGAVGNLAEVFGRRGRQTVQETSALGALGVQPTAAQERYSRLVLRLNGADEVTVVTVVASAGAIGAGPLPVINRATDLPLALVKQVGSAAITQGNITDEREWTGDYATLPEAAALPVLPIGSLRRRGGTLFSRDLVSSIPTWVDTSAPIRGLYQPVTLTPLPLVSGNITAVATDVGGSVATVVTPAGTGRVIVRADITGLEQGTGDVNAVFRVQVNGAVVGAETRIRAGDRSGMAQGELAVAGGVALQLRCNMRSLGGADPVISSATVITYTLFFASGI